MSAIAAVTGNPSQIAMASRSSSPPLPEVDVGSRLSGVLDPGKSQPTVPKSEVEMEGATRSEREGRVDEREHEHNEGAKSVSKHKSKETDGDDKVTNDARGMGNKLSKRDTNRHDVHKQRKTHNEAHAAKRAKKKETEHEDKQHKSKKTESHVDASKSRSHKQIKDTKENKVGGDKTSTDKEKKKMEHDQKEKSQEAKDQKLAQHGKVEKNHETKAGKRVRGQDAVNAEGDKKFDKKRESDKVEKGSNEAHTDKNETRTNPDKARVHKEEDKKHEAESGERSKQGGPDESGMKEGKGSKNETSTKKRKDHGKHENDAKDKSTKTNKKVDEVEHDVYEVEHDEHKHKNEAETKNHKKKLKSVEPENRVKIPHDINSEFPYAKDLQKDAEAFVTAVHHWTSNVLLRGHTEVFHRSSNFSLTVEGPDRFLRPCGDLVAHRGLPIVKHMISSPEAAKLTSKQAEALLWHPSKKCLHGLDHVVVDTGSHMHFQVMCASKIIVDASVATGGAAKKQYSRVSDTGGAVVTINYLDGQLTTTTTIGSDGPSIETRQVPPNTNGIHQRWRDAIHACKVNRTLSVSGVVGGGWRQVYERGSELNVSAGYAQSFSLFMRGPNNGGLQVAGEEEQKVAMITSALDAVAHKTSSFFVNAGVDCTAASDACVMNAALPRTANQRLGILSPALAEDHEATQSTIPGIVVVVVGFVLVVSLLISRTTTRRRGYQAISDRA